jgi:hypothetical protein
VTLIRSARHRVVLARSTVLAIVLAAVVGQLHAQGDVTPTVHIELAPTEQHYRARIEQSAVESSTQYRQWLGPSSHPAITFTTSVGSSGVDGAPNTIVLDLPWRTADPMMEVEAQVAYGLAMQYWPHDAGNASFVNGLSWYLQSHLVERLFNIGYARPGHSIDGVRLFGGFVPWGFESLRLSRWRGGLAWERFASSVQPRLWPPGERRLPREVNPSAVRGALAFASLERYLGWPVLQGALRTLAGTMSQTRLTREHAAAVVGAAAGQDLTWFFDVAFDQTVLIDYAVTQLHSSDVSETCSSERCYRTGVTVVRLGKGLFTGTSHAPVAGYDAGQGMSILVDFGGGHTAMARWDGRAAERRFDFESTAPAASAQLNPDGTLLLDPTPLDHSRYTTSRNNTPMAKWVSRWVVWLQNAMLTCAMLV